MYYLCIVKQGTTNRSKNEKNYLFKKTLYIFIVQRWQVNNKTFSNLQRIIRNVLPLHRQFETNIKY